MPTEKLKNVNSTVEIIDSQEETNEVTRETWSGKFDFFLATLGYAVGLGAVWRFPYLCYRNGGGVFLIPYVFFLIMIGIPLVFLELSVGQFISQGPLTCWKLIPIFRGIGLSMNIANSLLSMYYNMIIAYSIYFLILSFNSKLPWQTCNPKWSSPNCVDDYSPGKFRFDDCDDDGELKCDNGKCFNLTMQTGEIANCQMNSSLLSQIGWWNPTFPSQDYWNKVILMKSSGIDESGYVVWQLVIMLFLAWLIVFLTVFRGIHVSGKVVYFTSLFPYVVLFILGVRAWMLPGASKGIHFYLSPNFYKLADVRVWSDAAVQIFFTLSVSYGGLCALSSYNNFNKNVMRDAIIVSVSNCLTSIFAGFVVFAFIGYLSHTTGQDIEKVIQAGQGLSFVVYPYAVTTIKGAPFWSILFFFMMIILGLDTQMANTEITITSVTDIFPSLKKRPKKKYMVVVIICSIYFLMGLIFTIRSGTYWIEILDNYSGNWAILIIGAIECICVTWFYGFDRFRKDISIMIGEKYTNNKFFNIWRVLWTFLTPGILFTLVILLFKDSKRIELKDYVFPYWTHILGQIISTSTLSGIFIWAFCILIDALFIHKKPLKSLIQPDFKHWKPMKSEHETMMRIVHGADDIQSVIEQEVQGEKKGKENLAFETTL